MIGLKRHTVRLECESDTWLAYGECRCTKLRKVCAEIECDIQHVGSTSVRGLPAKPIIDLVIGLKHMGDLESVMAALISLGYDYRGIGSGSCGHLFILESAPNIRTEHLHVVILEDRQWEDYIVFRDAMRADPQLVEKYARLKEDLQSKYSGDRKSYTAGKADFIQSTLSAQRGDPADGLTAATDL
jgi:GrpB-like predicted nucleotidyltransferase (UPF0157 family)